METRVTDYKWTSFFLIIVSCLIQLISQIILASAEYRSPMYDWTASICSMAVPVSCFWIGGLLRTAFPNPKLWEKTFICALLPLMYVRLMIWPYTSVFYRLTPGYYIMMLSLVIVGFLLMPACKSIKDKRWLSLVLFLASAFCYVGIVRVSDHFSIANFTLRESEWTTLFTRMIKYVPLVMSLFFLMAFSMSETGQKIGSMKWLQWTTIALILVSGIYIYTSSFWYVRARFILFHPLTVYLAIVVVRIIRRIKFRESLKDVFKI